MTHRELMALAERAEREPASVELWIVIYQMLRPNDESPDAGRFAMFVLAGAYLDAADMLRPNPANLTATNVAWDSFTVRIATYGDDRRPIAVTALAHGPHAEARARLAAALRAHAAALVEP